MTTQQTLYLAGLAVILLRLAFACIYGPQKIFARTSVGLLALGVATLMQAEKAGDPWSHTAGALLMAGLIVALVMQAVDIRYMAAKMLAKASNRPRA